MTRKRTIFIFLGIGFLFISATVAVYLSLRLFQSKKQSITPIAPQPGKAAPSGTVIENETFRVLVIDTGPGNYESNIGFKTGGQTDPRPVTNGVLTQTYRITNKTNTQKSVKLIAFPYKMYTIGSSKKETCVDLYMPEDINNFVLKVGGGNLETSYIKFAEIFYEGVATHGKVNHCYDNPPAPLDPSTNQERITGGGPGSLTCDYYEQREIRRCTDSQTLVSYDQDTKHLTSDETLILAPGETKEVSFSIKNNVCGFYQWDHGLLYAPDKVFWTGSEIKFFPCETPPSISYKSCNNLVLTLSTTTPTPTPTTTPASCNNSCGSGINCSTGLVCSGGLCRNPSCTNETDCICSTPTPTSITFATQSPTPTPEESLPNAGTSAPTIFSIGAGILLIIISFVLAL